MATIVGFECDGGAVLAADRTLVRDGSVVSRDADHIFDFDGLGAAAVDASRGLDTFQRELDAALREFRLGRGDPGLAVIERLVAEAATEADADALVVARDDDGAARVRAVYRDGSVLDDPLAAMGSGAAAALGALESADCDVSIDEAEDLAREVLGAVAERDAATGEEVDVWRLANA